MALKQPLLQLNVPPGGLPRTYSRPSSDSGVRGWQKWSMVSLTVIASALLATLVTLGLLNMLLVSDSAAQLSPLPPMSSATTMQAMPWPPGSKHRHGNALQDVLEGMHAPSAAGSGGPAAHSGAGHVHHATAAAPDRPAKFEHAFKDLQHLYSLQPSDSSPRCRQAGICDGDHSCGPDKLGCVTAAKERQDHVRTAIAWSWEGYRKYAWGHDEVDVLKHKPHAWFNLGLTIVDSLDTLLIAGLQEEYQQARHWVANHLQFHEGSKVQFFEVNIRILGGLLSAYYLSDGDDMYLHKAQSLADRLMVAFNTSSGIPATFVNLKDAAGRRQSGTADVKTNVAEAGTISMEFTTIGRLLGRDDLFDAGMQFWYVLMNSQNFSGLYCMGIHTKNGECSDPKMTIGSAADSMYEYMLKQWLLSSGTQQVPLMLYKAAMSGVRQHLVRHVSDGSADMSFVSEAAANKASGVVAPTNDRFEHLTCFAGGMFVLGKLHNISTNTTPDDYDDITLGARIGRACYELYHQAPSGLAPDSVHYTNRAGGNLPHSTPLQEPKKSRKSSSRRLASSRARRRQARAAAAAVGASHAGTTPAAAAAAAPAAKKLLQAAEAHSSLQRLAGLLPSGWHLHPAAAAAAGATAAAADHVGVAESKGAASRTAAVAAGQAATSSQRRLLAVQAATAAAAAATSSGSAAPSHAAAQHPLPASSASPPPHLPSAAVANNSSSSSSTAPTHSAPAYNPPIVASWTQLSKGDFLRPETVETLFYLWRATGDGIYREWGWNMFRAFERFCRLESGGYATVSDVNQVPPKLADKMESFWLAETLKYFYLLFEDDAGVLPLDTWVFNTEAHPLPKWGTTPDVQALQRTKHRHQAAAQEQEHWAAEQAAALQEHNSITAKQAGRASRLARGKAKETDGYGLAGVQL